MGSDEDRSDPPDGRFGPAAADWSVFRDRLAHVLRHPLIAADPVAAALAARMARCADPAHFAELAAEFARRGLDLAYERHGAAGTAPRRPIHARPAVAEEEDEPMRLVLRL